MNKIYLLLIIGGTLLTCGDVLIKKWSTGSGFLFYIFAMVLYIVALTILGIIYKTENMAIASIAMVIINSLTLIMFGIFLYKETFSARQIIGLILAVISVFFLGL